MKNKYLKIGQIIFLVVLVIFVVYVFFHFAEISKIPGILKGLKWYYLLILLVFEALFLINRGNIFQVLYNRLGIKLNLKEATLLFTASYSLNVLIPTGGFSGISLFLAHAEKQKTSKSRVLLINLLFYFINFVSLAFLLLFAITYLFVVGKMENYYLISFAVLLLIILIFLAAIIVFIYFPRPFEIFLRKILSLINGILKMFKKNIPQNKIPLILTELEYLKTSIFVDKKLFWQPFWLFILGNIYEIVSLYLIFVALGVNPPLVALVAAYAIGLLFMIVSITPAGVGVVEVLMSLVFVSFGMPLEISVLAILIFRIITFWLPLPVGIILMKKYL